MQHNGRPGGGRGIWPLTVRLTLLAVLALSAPWATPTARAQMSALVVVDQARSEPLPRRRAVPGGIMSTRESLLASQVEGLVVTLDLNEGDLVERGQVVAELDSLTAELEVSQAEADVDAAQGVLAQRRAEADRADRDLVRFRKARDQGSLSDTEFDQAETNVATAKAMITQAEGALAAAEAALGLAQKRLRDKSIRSPFRGRVIEKRTDLGEWISPGDAIVRIVSLDDLEARVDVPEHLVGYLDQFEGAAPFTVPGLGEGAETVEGRFIGVIPAADELSRIFTARFAVDNAEGRLKPGMSVRAFVPTGVTEPTLTVSKDALLRDDAGSYVFMAVPFRTEGDPAVTAQSIPARVERLYASGGRVAIRSGQLQDGSLVLIEGNERAYPTQPLILKNPPPGSPFDPSAGPPGGGGPGGQPGGPPAQTSDAADPAAREPEGRGG